MGFTGSTVHLLPPTPARGFLGDAAPNTGTAPGDVSSASLVVTGQGGGIVRGRVDVTVGCALILWVVL